MTMLEKAARALFEAYLLLAYGEGECPADESEAIWAEGRDGYLTSARAVLEAVRVPSDEVLDAVFGDEIAGRSVVRIDFSDIISEILTEGKSNDPE